MIGLIVGHGIMALLAAFMWNLTEDFSFLCLLAIIYSASVHKWAKVWVRENEKWLEENKIWFDRAFYTLLGTALVYVAGLTFTQTGSVLFLKPVIIFVLVLVTLCALVSYVGVAHRLYSATYSGRRAVADAVFMASFPRTFYVVVAYASTVICYLQIYNLLWS